MNREEALGAVVAFLDQFIERGAAADMIGLRDRMRRNERLDEFAEWLPSRDPSATEVYEAMRRLFWAEAVSPGPDEPIENLETLFHWMRIEMDGISSDPAQWEDWLAVLRGLGLPVPDSSPPMSPPVPAL